MDFIKDFTVTREPGAQVKIVGEIPFSELEKHRNASITTLGKDVELDGFRKGHVPTDILVKHIGEMRILGEMAERAMSKAYPEAVKFHDLQVIGYPRIEITKLAPDNPLGFTATVAIVPEITLPDYKNLAANINKEKATLEVTDEEVEKQVKDIMRQKIAYERLQAKAAAKAKASDSTDLPTPETVNKNGETHTHADGTVHEGPAHDDPETEIKAVTDEEIPELTDEYVKGLGQPGQFESVEDFKKKLREHLEIQKKQEVEAAHRAKLTDKIVEESQFELPQILIDSEINQMFAQMEEDLKRANLKMDDYLGHLKKTKEDLVKEWKPAAEKRARLQLVLNEIAKKEEVTPDKEQLDAQVKQLLEQYKDADESRVRVYVASVMTNEAVMKLLENQV